MPTQDFLDTEREASPNGSDVAVQVAWDFGYSEIFVSIGERTFQLHDLTELRDNGVRIPSNDGEVFIYLARTPGGERFQVSVDERALNGATIDFANAASPVKAALLARPVSSHRPAPTGGRWKMNEHIEGGRRWCRTFAFLAAGSAFILSTRFPTSQLAYRRQSLEVLIALTGVWLIVDLLSRTDRVARYAMMLATLTMPAAMGATLLAYWRIHLAGLGLLEPWSFSVPGILFVFGLAGHKVMMASSSGAHLTREAKERNPFDR